jgi:hypothetical protein
MGESFLESVKNKQRCSAYFLTDSYAASNIQPVFFGCMFEWRLPTTPVRVKNKQCCSAYFFTDSYAASNLQPVFLGCMFEAASSHYRGQG